MSHRTINNSSRSQQTRCTTRRRSHSPDRRRRLLADEPVLIATIADRQPDPSYPEGLSALADALVLQMFDSGVGETLRMAYTMIQQHQERQNRRTQRSAATEALREHLARLDETQDDL
jgi:hypothetical protein